MHVALVSHGLPHPTSNGGPMTVFALLRALLERGHRVTVVALGYPDDTFMSPERVAHVRAAGAEVAVIDVKRSSEANLRVLQKARRLVAPRPDELFPTRLLQPTVHATLAALAPDAIFVYHWDTLAAVEGTTAAPVVVGVGDPWHLPSYERWRATRASARSQYALMSLRALAAAAHYPRAMVALMRRADLAGCFQAREAAELTRRGAPCEYWPSPVVDLAGPHWRERRAKAAREGVPRILLGPSNLNASSTSLGLAFYAREVHPHLEATLGADGFETHVVGEGTPPPELAALLPRPSIVMRGRVEPPDDEFLSCDVQLVPTPVVLGVRVRIITGMSFGCAIVAHVSERANLPELDHGENALLGDDGRSIAASVVRALRDPKLRKRLGEAARRTYETTFAPAVAAETIISRIESSVKGVSSPHA